MEPQIQYCTTSDGVSIAYWAMGDGPPLIYLPALAQHVQLDWQLPVYRQFYEWLATRHRLVRYDRRNTGLSQRTVEDVSLEAHELDVEAVADRLGIGEFSLFAHGTSVDIAIAFAAHHPLRVRRLFLVDATITLPGVGPTPALRAVGELLTVDWETFTETVAGIVWGWAAGEQTRQFAALLRDSATQDGYARGRPAASDVSSLLAQVAAQTLVVHHRDAITTTIETGRGLAAGIPGARLVTLEGRAVSASLVDPVMKAAVDAFLDEDGAGPTAAVAEPHRAAGGTVTVLFTDIVDSTALTERLGDTVFRTASRTLDEGMRAAMREAGGAPVEGKVLGDGVMAVFTSASQAIVAARRCIELSAASELRLHVGLHAGDVIHEAGNVYGGAVNIASRICGLSAPGEVLVSRTVADLARTSAGVEFEDRGEQVLKGIEDPVRVYEVRWPN